MSWAPLRAPTGEGRVALKRRAICERCRVNTVREDVPVGTMYRVNWDDRHKSIGTCTECGWEGSFVNVWIVESEGPDVGAAAGYAPMIFFAEERAVGSPLVTRSVCSCGAECVDPAIPTGTLYELDLSKQEDRDYTCVACGKAQTVRVVWVDSSPYATGPGWAPLGVFQR